MADILTYYDEIINFKKNNQNEPEAINLLNYAFEYFSNEHEFKNPFSQIAIKNSIRIAENTEILVVIGYSFPIFNRSIDKFLIEHMTNLNKVYIQDISPDNIYTTMKNSFKNLQNSEINSIDIVKNNNLDQFLLPYELDFGGFVF